MIAHRFIAFVSLTHRFRVAHIHMPQWTKSSLVHMMVCHLSGTKQQHKTRCRRHADVWSHPVTIRCIHLPHHGHTKVNVMVMNGRLTSHNAGPLLIGPWWTGEWVNWWINFSEVWSKYNSIHTTNWSANVGCKMTTCLDLYWWKSLVPGITFRCIFFS